MKKNFILTMMIIPVLADAYTVPDISDNTAPLPLLSPDMPLSERDQAALKYADQWLQGKRYPYRESDRVVYLYGAGQPTLVCAPLELCVIYLQAGERVVENGVHLGDAVRWQIAPAVGADERTQLVVKPVDVGLKTSLVVITDRRTYHVNLISRKHDYMPGIAFKYPGNLAAQWQDYYQQSQAQKTHQSTSDGVDLADLDFNYHITYCSSCNFKPIRVYNDGSQTVIEMSSSLSRTNAPALLINDSQGQELVNYRLDKQKYVVDRLFDEAILISGVGRKQQKVIIKWQGARR